MTAWIATLSSGLILLPSHALPEGILDLLLCYP